MKFSYSNRGYTLLFATLTATVVLSVAIFISSVSRKQYILASTARDSLFAIYNADSALECAAASLVPITGGSFYCNDSTFSVSPFNVPASEMAITPDGWDDPAYESEPIVIPFESAGQEKGCAIVTFIEGTKTEGAITNIVNSIEARGYNLGNASECPKIGPRTVERALRVTYGE